MSGGSFELVAGQPMEFGAGFKVCKECGDEKPLVEFRAEKKGVQGRKAICKVCQGVENPRKGHKKTDMVRGALVEAWENIIREKYL